MTDKNVTKSPATQPATTSAGTLDPFATLRQRMERIFDDFQTGWPSMSREFWGTDFPDVAAPMRQWAGANWGAVDVTENDKGYAISIELPGCEESDIDVSSEGGVLRVTAEKKQESTDDKAHVTERRYGSFQRSLRLPDGIDRDKIEAHYKKGVLHVALPKTTEAQKQSRKIEIKSA